MIVHQLLQQKGWGTVPCIYQGSGHRARHAYRKQGFALALVSLRCSPCTAGYTAIFRCNPCMQHLLHTTPAGLDQGYAYVYSTSRVNNLDHVHRV